jgi:hypothetical protein
MAAFANSVLILMILPKSYQTVDRLTELLTTTISTIILLKSKYYLSLSGVKGYLDHTCKSNTGLKLNCLILSMIMMYSNYLQIFVIFLHEPTLHDIKTFYTNI